MCLKKNELRISSKLCREKKNSMKPKKKDILLWHRRVVV